MSSDSPMVLAFVMSGCGSCEMFKPVLEEFSKHYGRCLPTQIVDVYDNELLADHFKVESTPTVVGVTGQRAVSRIIGYEGDKTRTKLAKLYERLARSVTTCDVGPFEEL